MRQNAIPLPVRAPLGVDIYTVQRERPFAPRHQVTHQRFDAVDLPGRERLFALRRHAVQQIQTMRRQFRQKLHGVGPLLQQTMLLIALPGGNLRRQGFQPVGKVVFGNQLIEITELDHAASPALSATREPKLKHWNHSSLCSNPALRRRALWVSTESVSMTFSSMLRFWLISSSL